MESNYLCEYVKYLLEFNEIKTKDIKTIYHLTNCIENIIFNVVSIASVITFINNSKSIKKESIDIITKYLKNACGNPKSELIKGGGGAIVMPSEFYGINSMRYSPNNNIHNVDTLHIDFSKDIARPQIGGGVKTSKTKPIIIAINDILSYYKLKSSNEIKNKILKLIESYIKCLIIKLKNLNKTITIDIINNSMKSNKMFELFK